MKEPRNGSLIGKFHKHSNPNNSNNKKNLYELSLSLIFSLWCLVFLFYTRLGHSHGNGGSNYTIRETWGLEEVIWSVLGYNTLLCEVQTQKQKTDKPLQEQKNSRNSHPTYLGFDEFRNKTRQEGQDVSRQLENITHRLEPGGAEYNYASDSKGAKVVAHNKEAKGASNILGKDQDKYLRNPCSVEEKFVVIELADETLVDAIKIANFEHYSSNFKDFELSGSLSYPTEKWTLLGSFIAANGKHAQRFVLPEPKWVRYLRLKSLSHYGSEFYCTLSILEVYGVDALERMLEDLIVSEEPVHDQSSSKLNTTGTHPRSEPCLTDKGGTCQIQTGVATANKGIDNIDHGQKLDPEILKNAVLMSNIPDPVMEIRQHPIGRVPGDAVLKILMQKVRSLELNLSVLGEYIKELNRRQGDSSLELYRELSQNALLLEKTKSEIKDIMEGKVFMEIEIGELRSWKSLASSQINALMRENSMLRSEVGKIVNNQASLENKELAVLVVSFCFAFVAFLKLVSDQILIFIGASEPGKLHRTSRGWLLILISSGMTLFITLLF